MTSSIQKRIIYYLILLKLCIPVLSSACDSDEYECRSGKCVDSEYLCDGDNDCGDFSDESAALCYPNVETITIESPSVSNCESNQFDCTDKCISINWVCDGEEDCDNDSDEDPVLCSRGSGSGQFHSLITTNRATRPTPRTTIRTGYSRIGLPTFIYYPITRTYEKIYPEPTTVPTTTWKIPYPHRNQDVTEHFNSEKTCSLIEFRCRNKLECINNSLRCDKKIDCSDGSDEMSCQHFNSEKTCSSIEFRCGNKLECINNSLRCDKQIDCSDGSDEMSCDVQENCDTSTESSGLFSSLSWMEALISLLTLIIVIGIVILICRRRRMHVTTLNSKRGEERQTVSYINAPTSECQLVLVSSAVNVQPAVFHATPNDGRCLPPPPYDTQPATSSSAPVEPRFENSTKKGEHLV